MSESHHTVTPARTPVYFLGIGGPNFMENTNHPAYTQLAVVGKEITTKVKPKAVVVISAHWQASPDTIHINADENPGIIYDFYGFPKHYYEYKFPYKGRPEIADKVATTLAGAGLKTEKVSRGLDHGVWVGFIPAFDPQTNPLNVPIIQVSLYTGNDWEKHYRLGKALGSLRNEGILVIGAGMAVHNLHDFRASRGSGQTKPYAFTFDEALKDTVTAKPEDRHARFADLMQRSDTKHAHPTLEHLLPMHVSAGAAGLDLGEQLWTMPEGSLSWAQYRFGSVE